MGEPDEAMSQTFALWALGFLCSAVEVLVLIVLARIQKQGDDTNTKVGLLAETSARIETAANLLAVRVASIEAWRLERMQTEINDKASEIAELRRQASENERRHVDLDRRGS